MYNNIIKLAIAMYTIKVHIAALTYYAEDYPELKGYVIEVSQTGTEIING